MASETSEQLIGKTIDEGNEMIRKEQIFHGGKKYFKPHFLNSQLQVRK